MQIILDTCPICDASDWHDLDYLRNVDFWYSKDRLPLGDRVGFKVCKSCGFVTYDYQDLETLSSLYDAERRNMQAMNIITCNRKNQYHKKFLHDILKNADKDFTVLDHGCAQGALLHMMNTDHQYMIPVQNLYGTEWSDGFRQFANKEYGLFNVTKDINTDVKYDLICLYHVLEHLQWPDVELEKLKGLLKPNGVIYIAVPEYMGVLDDASGLPVDAFENLFHLNHVNCFTETSFKNLLSKAGLSIIYNDGITYGMTVICKSSPPGGTDSDKSSPPVSIKKQDYREMITSIERQKKAIELLGERKFDEAIEMWPRFPDAYLFKALTFENLKDFDGQLRMLTDGQKACGMFAGNHKLEMSLARLFYQFDENTPQRHGYYGNNIKRAESILLDCLEHKPGNDEAHYMLGILSAQYKQDYETAVYHMKQVCKINPTRWAECYNMIGSLWAKYGRSCKTI